MGIRKIIADTFYEATLRADNMFGKDNYDIVKCGRDHVTTHWGFGRKETTVLLVKEKITRPDSIIKVAPTRPSESMIVNEIEPTRTASHSMPQQDRKPSVKSHRHTISSMQAAKAYGNIEGKACMRPVNGIRSNQEGDLEPQTQRIEDQEAQVSSILEALTKAKTKNAQVRKAVRKPSKRELPTQIQSELALKSAMPDDQLDTIQCQIETLMTMIKGMNIQTTEAVKKPVSDIPNGLFTIREKLLSIDTPVEVTDNIISHMKDQFSYDALQHPTNACKEALVWLKDRLKFEPDINFSQSTGPKVIMLFGPTGVGKTTTIAKLAAAYGLSGTDRKSVTLFTLDTYRIAATDQLAQYAKIIEMKIEVIMNSEDVEDALERHKNQDLIIVDTAGRGQSETREIEELGKFVKQFPDPEKYLVVSATSKYADILSAANSFSELDYNRLIFTKLDETNTIGSLLALQYTTGKPLSYITDGQGVPCDIKEAGFSIFENKLFM